MKKITLLLASSCLATQAVTLASFDIESTTTPYASTANVLTVTDLVGAGRQQNTNPNDASATYNGTYGGHINEVSTGNTVSMSFTTALGATGDSVTYESFSGVFFDPSSRGWTASISWSDSNGQIGSTALTVNDGVASLADFTDFTSSETITWTLSGVNGGGAPDRLRFDDLALSGTINTVSVPEPSATALLGLGALALFTRRKR